MVIRGLNEEDIFRKAIQYQDRDEQVKYVKRACGDDTELYEAVESLLRYHNSHSILDGPAIEVNISDTTSPVTEGPGTRIDRYKLLEKIGEGGMAVVYMAQQEEPIRRRVALKIIKLGMDTRQVIARFEAERQALAMMDHSNIAKVLDAGSTESGRPYFVMDLVPGLSITQYCDKNRLSIEGRLKLFIQICNAIQHAHQKGIIHRDVKPSNIIVTMHDGEPVPKVIDFGIAKATNQRLTEKTLFTRHAQIIGTPAYMSPEQAELSDWDVDTRTDIYSLGILLYELLTGTTPFSEEQLREVSYLQMQKIICEAEPTKPSTKLSTLGDALTDVAKWHSCSPELMPKLVRGDLDWIVMKTLEKNRTRRYDTANSLAADVQRHLNSEPVEAAAPSIFYKFRKFTKRHIAAVLAGLFVLTALLVTAVVFAFYAIETNRARQETTALLAASYVDQAQSLCEQGHVGRGMLWLAHSLEVTPEDSHDLRKAIRKGLSAWHSQLHSLTASIQFPDRINDIALSPDGTWILAGCLDGYARLCDSRTGEVIGKPLNHGNQVRTVAIAPDGKRMATCSWDGIVRLWDAVTLESVGEHIQHGQCRQVVFTPVSSQLVTGGNDGAIRYWDVNAGKLIEEKFLFEGESGWPSIQAMTYSPEGLRVILRTGRGTYQMLDVESSDPVGREIDLRRPAPAVVIGPDGKRYLTGDGGGIIRVWDAVSSEQIQEPISHGGSTFTLAVSPDGSRIVSGGASRMARLWDATRGTLIGSPMRQQNTVTTSAFSPDGTWIVTGNSDGVVQRWDLVKDRNMGKLVEHEGRISGAKFVRNGLWALMETDDGVVRLVDVTTGEPIGKPFSHPQPIRFTALSPDGSYLVTQRGGFAPELRLWNVATGQLIGEMRHQEPHCVVFSPDCSLVITGGEDNIARMWDVKTLKCIKEIHQHKGVVQDAAFSPDGSKFLIGSFDGTTQMWDTATLEPIGKPLIHQSEVKGLAYSPDGTKILIGFADGTIRLYDAATREPIGTPLQHVELVCSVAYSPDGSQLLACSIDGTARLWDMATLKPIGPPLEHNCGWPTASFSPDGSQILLFGWGRARLWKAPSAPLGGECEKIVCWVQVITGMEFDSTGGINVLDAKTWNKRHRHLDDLGGPPQPSL